MNLKFLLPTPITVPLTDTQKSFLSCVIWELQLRKYFMSLLHHATSKHINIYKHKRRCKLYKRIFAKNYHIFKSIKRLYHFETY